MLEWLLTGDSVDVEQQFYMLPNLDDSSDWRICNQWDGSFACSIFQAYRKRYDVEKYHQGSGGTSIGLRLHMWKEILKIWQEHPLLVGAERFSKKCG